MKKLMPAAANQEGLCQPDQDPGSVVSPEPVKFVCWCDGGYSSKRLLLVYELMAKGSVDMYLHGSKRLLTWPERYKMCLASTPP